MNEWHRGSERKKEREREEGEERERERERMLYVVAAENSR